jgi:predicted Zn-dependent protease/transglutaminase-like putative cysteine protease
MKRLAPLLMMVAGCAGTGAEVREAPPAKDLAALYQRAVAAHESGQLDEAWKRWAALLGAQHGDCADGHCGDWGRYATAAARRLETLVGEVPGERAMNVEAQLAKLDPGKLPVDARRRLYGVRAAYARRRGDEAEARRLDRAGGCPDRWFASGPYGRLPRLDQTREFAPDSSVPGDLREAPARACQVVLDGPDSHQGVIYAIGWVRAQKDTTAVAVVETDEPFGLFVDGARVFTLMDQDRTPARTQEIPVALTAGWHRVAFKLAAPGGRADVELALLPLKGHDAALEFFGGAANEAPRTASLKTSAKASVPANEKVNGDPTSLAVAVEDALARGDDDRAEEMVGRLVEKAPKLAFAQLLAAQVALEDNSRTPQIAQDRARRALERALSLDPTLARARAMRALIALNADRPREALSRLADAPKTSAPYWRFAFVRYQALKARGWLREAEEALAEARRTHPDGCAALEAEIAQKRERHDVAAALTLAKQASWCNGGSDELADTLREKGDLDGAVTEYRRLLALDPSRESWRAGLAETLMQAGQAAEAEKVFAALAQRYPRATHYRRQLADARVALADIAGARRALEDGLAESPESQELQRALEAICIAKEDRGCGVLDDFRVDGKQVIAQYVKEKPVYTSPAVIVLDRTVTRVFPTGARLTLTHNIIQVLAKDGIDKFGEVQIPAGADVLTLRTVKQDGTTREPEEITEKETVSVPDLEVGDFVEFEYVDPAPPPGAFPRGFLAERFFFRSFDAPLDRTEYLLVTPAGMPVQIDRRGDAPELSLVKRDALELRTWEGRRRPQAFSEPSAAPFAEILPSVRAASGVSFDAWKDYLRDGQFGTQRSNPELRAIVERETAGKKDNRERVLALDAWVRRHVRGAGGLDESATSILAREQGNRITVIAGLLRAAGIPSEIWLARPLVSPVLEGALPDLEAYDQPLLKAPDFVIDPRYRHSPTGFVTPVLRGAAALRLTPEKWAPAKVDVPNPDDRHMELSARLEMDGSAEVLVREKLRGWPAVEWREALEKLSPDRVRPEFEQRTLGFYFPGSTLTDLSWSGENDDGGLFTVEYKFRSPQLARRIGGRLVLPAPYPAMLGKRYVGVATRRTPLAVDYAAPTVLSAQIAVPRGVDVQVPPAVKADGFGAFEQIAERTPEGFRLKASFAMPRTRVQPERYRDFVDFATRVDRAEARAAELSPK